jgi:hypothetical protein
VFKTVEGKKNNDNKGKDKGKDNDKDKNKKDKNKKDNDKKDKDKKDKDKKDKDKKDKDKKDKDKKDKDKKKNKKDKNDDDEPGNTPTAVTVASVLPYESGNYTVFPQKQAPGLNIWWTAQNTGDTCPQRCDSVPGCTGYVTSRNVCYFLTTKDLANNLWSGSSDVHVKKNIPLPVQMKNASYVKKPDTDYPDGNLAQTQQSTVEGCKKACDIDPSCLGYTFANDNTSMCSTKSLLENETQYMGIDAYVKTV